MKVNKIIKITYRCLDITDHFIFHLNSSLLVFSLYLYQNIVRNLSGQKSSNMKSISYTRSYINYHLFTLKSIKCHLNTAIYIYIQLSHQSYDLRSRTLFYASTHKRRYKMKIIKHIMMICQTNTSENIRKHLSTRLNSS